jgi:hypothetical protein
METRGGPGGEDWNRYGLALITAMREVLDEVDEAQRETLLETADFWLRLGLVIGIEHADEAKRLLSLSQEDAGERAELLKDAEEWLAETIE